MSSKQAKERFVSGHNGTSLEEIYLLTTTLIAGYLLRCVLLVCLPSGVGKSPVLSIIIDYATIIAPGVLIFTVLANYTVYILGSIILAVLLLSLYHLNSSNLQVFERIRVLSTMSYPVRLPCLTLTRTFVTLITAVAILAVDFQIFPRRFAKAETYGTGLMDVGVGAFIMSHGLTSPEARGRDGGRINSVLKGLLPLVVIGVLRLLAVKSTEYQEHVSEYGVHWNFFFTIAAVRLLATFLHPVLTLVPAGYGLASLLTALTYQLALSQLGLSQYIQHGPHGDGLRPTLFSANREGICSCVGYLAIYLGHVQIGQWLFKPRESVQRYVSVLFSLLCMFCVFYCLTLYCDAHVESTSRRLVNLAYITWIFSYGSLIVGLFLLTDIVLRFLSSTSPPTTDLSIVAAVDYNQLGFFLLANLLTGGVNFSMDTLSASWVTGLTVLCLYMAVLAFVFCVLYKLKIKIKL